MAMTDADPAAAAAALIEQARNRVESDTPSPLRVWTELHRHILTPDMDFEIHLKCYRQVYGSNENADPVRPSWIPTENVIEESNIAKMMKQLDIQTYQEFYNYSITQRSAFWNRSLEHIGIVWDREPTQVFPQECSATNQSYFADGRLNITDSLWNKRDPHEPAIIYAMESAPRDLQTMSFATLSKLSNQISNALLHVVQPGDAVAICMPMTPESIALYIGIVQAGCVVVSIADSFSAPEIATRCRIANAKAIVTQDVLYRGAKVLPLYPRVVQAVEEIHRTSKAKSKQPPPNDPGEYKESKFDEDYDMNEALEESPLSIIVVPGLLHAGPYPRLKDMSRSESGTWNDKDADGNPVPLHDSIHLRSMDMDWHSFLSHRSDEFTSIKCAATDACNILFSSGTTGDPKAIVWSHTTPFKCAVDGFYHQNISPGETVCWPTNLGWMMGPWLLYQFLNGATLAIFNGVTSTNAFCQFVDHARIDMLGVIPSLVKSWQARNATEGCDWSHVKRFSSTGEASDPVNYLWLASRVQGYAPIIEYCGGTEIGGSFLSSTIVSPNVPSMFSTPVLGSKITILPSEVSYGSNRIDPLEAFAEKSDNTTTQFSGEVALLPPTVGLSTKLLNRSHFSTYFEGMPKGPRGEILRRHGDEIERVYSVFPKELPLPYYRALGRCDDTMNIGGIKVGSVEIERVCNLVPSIQETAAIGVPPRGGGPNLLVIYVVLREREGLLTNEEMASLKSAMQRNIKTKLNPLFGISDVHITKLLPRTASNKIMRRLLRDEYIESL